MDKNYTGLLILAFLSIALATTNAGCPSKCTCSEAVVNCTSVFLEAVPNFESLDVAPTSIDLSVNEIINIESTDFSFDGSSKVQYLYLADNSILDVQESAFLEMSELQEIYLARNLLESVPPMLIEENRNLVLLDLSGNFFDMNSLELHSDSLEVLDLSSSKISSFTEDNIQYLPNLKVLNLRFNNLKFIEPSVFNKPNLLSVDVYYNVWECNQNTIDLFNFLVLRNLTEIKDPIKCITDDQNYKDIYTRNGPVIASLNVEESNKIETEPKDVPDYYDLRDDAELTWEPYPYESDLQQILDTAEGEEQQEQFEQKEEDQQEEDQQDEDQQDEQEEAREEDEELDDDDDEDEDIDKQEEENREEEKEETNKQQKEDGEEYVEEERAQQQDEEETEENENYQKQQYEQDEQREQEYELREEEPHEQEKNVEEQEGELQGQEDDNKDQGDMRANESEETQFEKEEQEQREREERLKQEEEEMEKKVLAILQSQQDYQEASENDKTEEEDSSSIDIAIIREQHYFVVYQPDTAEPDQTDYQFYFTNNLAVLIGVTAFILAFLFGTFVGLCTMSKSIARRSWRRRDMTSSTSTLISKLSQDIA